MLMMLEVSMPLLRPVKVIGADAKLLETLIDSHVGLCSQSLIQLRSHLRLIGHFRSKFFEVLFGKTQPALCYRVQG